jgi:urea carboxylase-associated protein 2
MSDTATTRGARDHARAQEQAAASRVTAKPTIPARLATALPAGVTAERIVWDETLAAGDYAGRVLERGWRVRLENLDGDGCVNLLVFNADQPAERLNVADTVKVQWQAYLDRGALLLSDMGRVLLSITDDTCGNHDALCGASTARSNAATYGAGAVWGPQPAARDRFLLALAKHGLGRRDIGPNVNLFKRVTVEADGSLTFVERSSAPGQHVELRAEMRVLLVLANTPHVLDPRPAYTATPVRVLAYRGPVTPADDPIRTSSPERRRAFENTEDYYADRA